MSSPVGRGSTAGVATPAGRAAGPKGGKMGDEEGEDFDFEDGEDPEGKKGRSGTSGGGPSATGSADGPEEGAGKPKGRCAPGQQPAAPPWLVRARGEWLTAGRGAADAGCACRRRSG